MLLARLTGASPWSQDTWQSCRECSSQEGALVKATLSFASERLREVRKVRDWKMRRPAACVSKRHQKRTVFTKARVSKLRTQGARKSAG